MCRQLIEQYVAQVNIAGLCEPYVVRVPCRPLTTHSTPDVASDKQIERCKQHKLADPLTKGDEKTKRPPSPTYLPPLL